MIKGIHVLEDIISKDKQNILENYLKSTDVKWNLVDNLWYRKDIKTPQSVVYLDEIKNNTIVELINEIKNNTTARLGFRELEVYRIKVNKLEADKKYNLFNNKISTHIDRDIQHISMIYYSNNADGDTKFYNLIDGRILNIRDYIKKEEFSRFQEIKSVTPKKGSIVVFDGYIPHHSCYPERTDRYVVNYNIVPELSSKALM